MIVKVQIGIYSTEPKKQVLIYNKSKRIWWEGIASREVLKEMNGELKKFFYAKLVDDEAIKKAKKVQLLEEAPWQTW